jgi:hypothetical protein
MRVQRRDFLLSVTFAAAIATAAMGQTVTPSPTKGIAQGAASIPDFSGVWRHGSLPWFEPPESGPAPVTNRSRRNGVSNYDQLVGDYTNPILKPWAAEVVKKYGEISLAGITFPSPSNQCWPEPVPYIFKHGAMQLLQQPDKITILYWFDHQVRHVRMNQSHPARVTPSWSGDSVGHYEGDTLVIDTIGVKVGPFAMVDIFGTPHTEALHVVERYRLLDYEAAKEAQERGEKENVRIPAETPIADGIAVDPDYKGKGLQLQFTVEDEGVFTMPWSATITWRRPLGDWSEHICAENRHEYYSGKDTAVPTADKPDF